MTLKLKKISVMPVALLFCALHAVIGFVIGVIVGAGALMGNDPGPSMGLGVWSMLIFPLINAAVGFLAGSFLAWCYNFFVEYSGIGIKMEFEEEDRARLSVSK